MRPGKLIDKVWSRDRVVEVGSNICDPSALQAVVRWCYTARLEVPPAQMGACLTLLHELGLYKLEEELAEEKAEEKGES